MRGRFVAGGKSSPDYAPNRERFGAPSGLQFLLAERLRRNCPEPAIGERRLQLACRAWGVDRADAACAFDIDQDAVLGPIDPGDGNSIVRRYKTVAGVDEARLVGPL